MTVRQVTLLSCLAAALAGWLAVASAPNERPVSASVLEMPPEAPGAMLTAAIDRLHQHAGSLTAPAEPSRNLFRFAMTVQRPDAVPSALAEASATPQPVSPPTPIFRLIGMAEDQGADGPERTAIISGSDQLFFVKEGDHLTERFRVSRISEEVVELTDLDGASLRLALP